MQTENYKKVALMIHDLTPWGGQDRSTLEIAWNLNKKHPLEVHSYQLVGYDNWPDLKHIPYSAPIDKPIIFKYLHYYRESQKQLKAHSNDLIQSTGTASLTSDIVQVQFIHHTWLKLKTTLDLEDSLGPFYKQAYHFFLNKFKLAMEKKLYTKNKHYIAISHSIKKELIEHFQIPHENIDIVHHGVNPQHFHPYEESAEARKRRQSVRQELGITDDKIVLLHVGAINERKGLHAALKTVQQLHQQGFKNIHYLAVGQGNPEGYKEWCRKQGIEKHVSFVSHCKDIRTYYWASDIFFFPSLYEPFGLVILEAMSCGLPSLVSRTAGGAEVIEENVSGLTIANPKQSLAMARQLDPLLKNPELRKTMSKEARKTALMNSWEKVAEKYSRIYQKLDKGLDYSNR